MGRYPVELKLKAIEDWREGKMSIAEIIRKYNISPQTLNRWVAEYDSQGIDGLVRKPKNKIHTGEFKQTVVEDMRKNGLSQSEVSRKYSIGRRQVQVWERIYLQEGPKGLYIERRGRGLKLDAPKEKITLDKAVEEDLIAENQRLRMENEYLKKLNALIQAKEK
jgi:transposase